MQQNQYTRCGESWSNTSNHHLTLILTHFTCNMKCTLIIKSLIKMWLFCYTPTEDEIYGKCKWGGSSITIEKDLKTMRPNKQFWARVLTSTPKYCISGVFSLHLFFVLLLLNLSSAKMNVLRKLKSHTKGNYMYIEVHEIKNVQNDYKLDVHGNYCTWKFPLL